MKERWRWIPGFEKKYQILKNVGTVKSFIPCWIWDGKGWQWCESRIVKQFSVGGRLTVNLRTNKKHKAFRVHRLLLLTFTGPCPPGKVGCHRDDDCTNNHIDNLYWGTPAENVQDAIRNGKVILKRKLTEDRVRKIRRWKADGKVLAPLANKFGVSAAVIYEVANGTKWKHVQ